MARRDKSRFHGVFNIDKAPEMTSHDVVDEIRRLLRQRRVGHAGTLDPRATVVVRGWVGTAPRLCEYLVEGVKEYCGTIRLGATTSTYDAEGEVVEERNANSITREDVEHALDQFVGEIEQKPPAYSAIKTGGVPAYKRARRGEDVDLPARRVKIESIDVLDYETPDVRVRVRCHAGTYVRSLAHDLGETLGVGAHLASLARTANGTWRVDDAVSLDDIATAIDRDDLGSVLRPFDDALDGLPKVTLDELGVKHISSGAPVMLDPEPELSANDQLVCAHDAEGHLLAVLAPAPGKRWKPKKVFPRS